MRQRAHRCKTEALRVVPPQRRPAAHATPRNHSSSSRAPPADRAPTCASSSFTPPLSALHPFVRAGHRRGRSGDLGRLVVDVVGIPLVRRRLHQVQRTLGSGLQSIGLPQCAPSRHRTPHAAASWPTPSAPTATVRPSSPWGKGRLAGSTTTHPILRYLPAHDVHGKQQFLTQNLPRHRAPARPLHLKALPMTAQLRQRNSRQLLRTPFNSRRLLHPHQPALRRLVRPSPSPSSKLFLRMSQLAILGGKPGEEQAVSPLAPVY